MVHMNATGERGGCLTEFLTAIDGLTFPLVASGLCEQPDLAFV